jgi:hypothetical protein
MDTYARNVEETVQAIARDTGSLHDDVTAWAGDSTTFVQELDAAVNDVAAAPDADYSVFRDALFDKKSALALDRETLAARCAALRQRAKLLSLRLEGLEKPDRSALLYAQGAVASEAIASRVVASLATLDATLERVQRDLGETWEPAWQKANLKLEAWLSTANVPEWKVKAAELKRWFTAHQAVERTLAPLEARVEILKDLVIQKRAFAAKDLASRVEASCAEARTRFASDAAVEPIRDAATARLGVACKASRDRLTALWGNPAFVPEVVIGFAEARSRVARTACAAPNPAIDCATAAWLARIPRPRVRALSEGELRAYETAWAKATGLSEGGAP